MSKKLESTIIAIALVIILIGTIMTFTVGFNVDLIYSKNKEVTISINKDFDIEDIKQIVKEATNKDKMIVQKESLYKNVVSIKMNDITQDELETINNKINEKYELENSIDDLKIIENANVKLKDLVKPYMYPIILSTILIIVYLIVYILVKAKLGDKLNVFENILKYILTIIISEGVLFGIIVISRIPVNRLTIPTTLAVYTIANIVYMCELEKKYKGLKIKNK